MLKKVALLYEKKEIEKHKRLYEELNSALDSSQEYKKDTSIQHEINITRNAAHNTIIHLNISVQKRTRYMIGSNGI